MYFLNIFVISTIQLLNKLISNYPSPLTADMCSAPDGCSSGPIE